jgi:drug/metabolite transporter (DMT)-like permease
LIERRMRADVALAFCSLLWGATFVVVRGALEHVSVFLFLAVRFSLAAVLLAIFQPSGLRNLKKQELFAGAALGLFMFGGYAFQTAGLQYTLRRNPDLLLGRAWCWCRCFWGFFGSGG